MNKEMRAKMVLAMEYIASCINDESVLDSWLMGGVPDGDIPYGSTDITDVDEWFLSNENFEDLMSCFLRCMKRAYNSGGLYCDKVVCKDKSDYERR